MMWTPRDLASSHTLVDVLRRRVELHGAEPSIIFLDEAGREAGRLTYAALDRRARSIAAALLSSAKPQDRALLLFEPGIDYVSAFFGCLYAGVIAIPTYPPDPARLSRSLPRLLATVDDSAATIILTSPMIAGASALVTAHAPQLARLQWLALSDDLPDGDPGPPPRPEDIAFLQYTSGSTSQPKGVVLTHANLIAQLEVITEAMKVEPHSCAVNWLPPYHDMGLIGTLLEPVYAGVQSVLMSPLTFLRNPFVWLKGISDFKGTFAGAPNFAFDLCTRKIDDEQRALLDLSSLEVMFNGAEPISARTLNNFAEHFRPTGFRRKAFYLCYGLAESTLMVTGSVVGAGPREISVHRDTLHQGRALTSLDVAQAVTLVGSGRACAGGTVKIVDPSTCAEKGPGEVGEVWVSSPSVGKGYWHRPEATDSTFRARTANGDGPFLRTGDLGFIVASELFVTGRIKDQIIVRGRNYAPHDLEKTAERAHPALRRGCAAAFSVTVDAVDCLVIVLEVERRYHDRRAHEAGVSANRRGGPDRRQPPADATLDLAPVLAPMPEIARAVRRAIADDHGLHAHSVVLIKTGTIPKTSSGKIQRRQCSSDYLESALEVLHDDRAPLVESIPPPPLGDSSHGPVTGTPSSAEVRDRILRMVAERTGRSLGEVDPAARFTDYGFDSLQMVRFATSLGRNLGRAVPVTALWDYPTIDALSAAVADAGHDARSIHPLTRDQRAARIPLSPAQERLWFLHKLGPEAAEYNESFAFELTGDLAIASLESSLNELVARHEALRTTFHDSSAGPYQLVVAARLPKLVPIESTMDDLALALRGEARRPFDLSASPVRFALFRLGPAKHVLLGVAHHMVCDGWSLGILVRELEALYGASRRGEAATLPDLPVQYPDYCVWQREAATTEALGPLLAYWRQELAGAPPAVELPTDHSRPALRSAEGARLRFDAGPALRDGVLGLARSEGATPFMVLLAVFDLVLMRYSGQRDILVGTPVAGRNHPELEGVVGMFVNTLVLRASVDPHMSFREHLGQVKATTLAAFANQELPFERLVESIAPPRDTSRTPLVQVMLAFQADRATPLALPNVTGRPVPVDVGTSKCDLVLFLADAADKFVGHFEFDTALFDATTIQRMAAHYQVMLEGVLADPDRRVSELPLLTAAERHQVLATWNDTSAHYPDDRCIHELFEAQAAKTPEAVAVIFEGQQLTYRVLNERANQLAHHLRALEVGPEVLVGLCLERSLEMVVGLLGILKAGGAYVPFDPTYPTERLAFMLADTGVPVLLTQRRLLDKIPEHRARVLCLDTDWPILARERAQNLPSGAAPDNLAYVIYTSGSTGKPKGVLSTHGGLRNRLLWMQDTFGLTSSDAVLQKTPYSFDVSVWEFFWPLLAGARLVVARPEGHRDSAYLAAILVAHRITTVHFVPPMLAALLGEPGIELGETLKRVICSGEALPFDLTQAFFARSEADLFNLYGPTEASIDVTCWKCQRHDPMRLVPIGRPIANTQIYVLDAHRQPTPIGVPGELFIGAWGSPAAT